MHIISDFTTSDLPALRGLLGAYLLEFDPGADTAARWDEEYLGALLEGIRRGSHRIVLARGREEVAAFAIVRIEQQWYRRGTRLGIVEEFYVAPSHRLQGIGQALAAQALGWLWEQGASAISAPVVRRNLDGLLFWQRLGFTIEAYQLFAPPP